MGSVDEFVDRWLVAIGLAVAGLLALACWGLVKLT